MALAAIVTLALDVCLFSLHIREERARFANEEKFVLGHVVPLLPPCVVSIHSN